MQIDIRNPADTLKRKMEVMDLLSIVELRRLQENIFELLMEMIGLTKTLSTIICVSFIELAMIWY